ncbi:MAG: HigA family addiction module antitoxin [Rhodomicrobium sp.]
MAVHSSRGLPPTHPGVYLREDVLPFIEPSEAEFAELLGIDEELLRAILEQREGINTETALRLGKALGNGARFWLTLQMQFDIWSAERDFQASIPQVKLTELGSGKYLSK